MVTKIITEVTNMNMVLEAYPANFAVIGAFLGVVSLIFFIHNHKDPAAMRKIIWLWLLALLGTCLFGVLIPMGTCDKSYGYMVTFPSTCIAIILLYFCISSVILVNIYIHYQDLPDNE